MLKANKVNASFTSQAISQGDTETDWSDYTLTVKTSARELTVLPGTTLSSLKTSEQINIGEQILIYDGNLVVSGAAGAVNFVEGEGVYLTDIASLSISNTPTKAWRESDIPCTYTSFEGTNRALVDELLLTLISSSSTQVTFSLPFSGVIRAGDDLKVDAESVTLSDVTEIVEATNTVYTCTFPTRVSAPVSASIPSRAFLNIAKEYAYFDDTLTIVYNKITKTARELKFKHVAVNVDDTITSTSYALNKLA